MHIQCQNCGAVHPPPSGTLVQINMQYGCARCGERGQFARYPSPGKINNGRTALYVIAGTVVGGFVGGPAGAVVGGLIGLAAATGR